MRSLRAEGTNGCRDRNLFLGSGGALSLADEVGVWDPSYCGMPGRELLVVDEAQLVGYLLGTQTFSDSAHGVVKNTVIEASMSNATPD